MSLYTNIDLSHAKDELFKAQRFFNHTPTATNWAKVTSRMEQYQIIWNALNAEREKRELWVI